MNTVTEVLYITIPWTEIIHLITNPERADSSLIQTSTHPALVSTRQYLQDTFDKGVCPFVPAIHNGNLYYALLYDKGEWQEVKFNEFFEILEPSLQKIRTQYKEKEKTEGLIDNITLFAILADPTLDNSEFSNKAEMAIMKKKATFIEWNRMGWAMVANPKAWATRISNPGKEENPIQHKISHPFKIDGYSALAYRVFHAGTLHKLSKEEITETNRKTAIIYGDIWSVRTPQDMVSCLKNNQEQSHKYISLFSGFLSSKIEKDRQYLSELSEGEKDPQDIILFLYEHYLMNIPHHCIDGIHQLLKIDFEWARNMLLSTIDKTEKVYNTFVKILETYRDGEIKFTEMVSSLQDCISILTWNNGGHNHGEK